MSSDEVRHRWDAVDSGNGFWSDPEPLGEADHPAIDRSACLSGDDFVLRLRATEVVEAADPVGQGYRDRALSEYHARCPMEWIEPAMSEVRPMARFSAPEALVDGINPRYEEGVAWQTNCVDCARAVERRWRGWTEEASGRVDATGESPDAVADWAGGQLRPVSEAELGQRLRDAGHGASAIVLVWGTYPDGTPFGHATNAVNHEGTTYLVDGQNGTVCKWPPSKNHESWSMVICQEIEFIGWDAERRQL